VIEIIVLSLIQGITEFLPISSSSHLILISDKFNFKNQDLTIDVSLHIGSFIAIMFYFRKDILNFFENRILFFYILISSLPIMIVGYLMVESSFIEKIRNIEVIAWTTTLFGILLYISDKFKLDKSIEKNLNFKLIFFIGLLQILSLIPGVSRSGIAITAARLLKFKRVDSAKLSFLLSIPILGAVSIFGLKNIILSENLGFTQVNLFSIIVSFLFSLITIKFFLKYISKFSLNIFVYYRVILGLVLLSITYL
tara:strand:- start:1753 stop:2511 length:759 start_codon:yes stop_codon:yes gene_type:complete